jgi:sulfotransferase
MQKIHFISGLPRSGSTLLAAIFKQNPRFHAGMSSPVANMYNSLLMSMSSRNELALFIEPAQRESVLKGLFANYYAPKAADRVVFDTNRSWCASLSGIARLFPDAKVICCVRNIASIIDSIERLVQANPFEISKMFLGAGPGGGGFASTVQARAEVLMDRNGIVRLPHDALQDAFYSEVSDRLVLVRYESLAKNPDATMQALYRAIGEPLFQHDFDNVSFEADEYDRQLGMPGLHRIRNKVQYRERPSILTPEISARFSREFWKEPRMNPRNVLVI